MRMAITVWNGRISPLFDECREILLVDIEEKRVSGRSEQPLKPDATDKIEALSLLKVETLLCGAISQALGTMLIMKGIRVLSFFSGDVDEVVRAFMTGRLNDPEFVMPGCGEWHAGRRWGAESGGWKEMKLSSGNGFAPRRGNGRGRMGGQLRTGPGGRCVCPNCGHREAHVRGVPCNQKDCPKCGESKMTRESS